MTNFLGNYIPIHSNIGTAAGQEAGSNFNAGTPVDLAAYGATKAVAIVHLGTRAAGSTLAVKLQTANASAGPWVDVPGSLSTSAADDTDNRFGAVEADTRNVRLRRYVRAAFQRKGGNSQVLGATLILGGLRKTASQDTGGHLITGRVAVEQSAI